MSDTDDALAPLCRSCDLKDGALAVPFDVMYAGQTCRAFAIRYLGKVQAYLNRCTHVAMEMDWQPNRFFDDSGRWLLCSTYGAAYDPSDGACAGGPCRGALVAVPLVEREGMVYWSAQYPFAAVAF